MKALLQLEEIASFLFSIYLFSTLSFSWWLYPLLFILPDLALLGLVVGRQVGMASYNLVHHKGIALGLFVAGTILGYPQAALAGTILLGHTSLDRVMGYGLMGGASFSHAQLKLFGSAAHSAAQ